MFILSAGRQSVEKVETFKRGCYNISKRLNCMCKLIVVVVVFILYLYCYRALINITRYSHLNFPQSTAQYMKIWYTCNTNNIEQMMNQRTIDIQQKGGLVAKIILLLLLIKFKFFSLIMIRSDLYMFLVW